MISTYQSKQMEMEKGKGKVKKGGGSKYGIRGGKGYTRAGKGQVILCQTGTWEAWNWP